MDICLKNFMTTSIIRGHTENFHRNMFFLTISFQDSQINIYDKKKYHIVIVYFPWWHVFINTIMAKYTMSFMILFHVYQKTYMTWIIITSSRFLLLHNDMLSKTLSWRNMSCHFFRHATNHIWQVYLPEHSGFNFWT